MIRQPEFVTMPVFGDALEQAKVKKPDIDFSGARFEKLEEGKCVQIMHIGPYAEETRSIDAMHAFAEGQGLKIALSDMRRHHEIYLSDPRKANPEKMKTVIRLPVE